MAIAPLGLLLPLPFATSLAVHLTPAATTREDCPMNRRLTAVATPLLTLLSLAATSSLAGSTAGAAAPSWSAVKALPTGSAVVSNPVAQVIADPAGGAVMFYVRDNVPTLTSVTSGGVAGGAKAVPAVPSLDNSGAPERINFLSDGASIVTWDLPSYGSYMAYRSPSGTFGKPVALPSGFSSLAVQPGNVLTETTGGGGIEVQDWTLSSTGALTAKGAAVPAYTGAVQFGEAWLALDKSGSAELVVNTGLAPVAVFRTAAGAWGSPVTLSPPGVDANAVKFAAAPDGRAIVGWVQVTGTNLASAMYIAIRTPGHSFGAKVEVASAASAEGATIAPAVAAGTDGTFAIGASTFVGNPDDTNTPGGSVRVVPADSTTPGAAVTDAQFYLATLGAANSEAIAGYDATAYAAGSSAPGSYREAQATTATIIPAKGSSSSKVFGTTSGLYDGNGSAGCGCAQAPPGAAVDGVALDTKGLAIAVGQLTPAGVLAYADRPGAAKAPAPKLSLGPSTLKATSSAIPIRVSCAISTCKGALTVTAKASGKTVTVAAATYSIAPGKHKIVKASLTKAGKKALAHAKKHHVKAKITATVKRGKTITEAVTVS
jgi:hypothetical protein